MMVKVYTLEWTTVYYRTVRYGNKEIAHISKRTDKTWFLVPVFKSEDRYMERIGFLNSPKQVFDAYLALRFQKAEKRQRNG